MNRSMIYQILIIIFLSISVFFISKEYFSKKHSKYYPINLVTIEYIKVDTVYVKSFFYREKPSVTKNKVSSFADTLVSSENDTINLLVNYYHIDDKFEYWLELRKAEITKTIRDSIFVPVVIPEIKEIYKNDYTIIGGVGVVGLIIGFVLGVLVD